MPEVHFTVRWPDGAEERCYSPSTVVTTCFEAGRTYPLDTFLDKARTGLNAASDRVAARYGFACSSAMAQLERIEATGKRFETMDGAEVALLSIETGGSR